jgi:DNA-binding GntR family transcriptional regulator
MVDNGSLRAVNQTRLSDQACEVLRDSILRKELAPGTRLDLDALQERLGISRTPLKDAINQLATEGLVTVIPRRGSYVAQLTPEKVAERFDAREVLELGAVEAIVSNVTDEDIAFLRKLYLDWKSAFAPDGLVSGYFRFLDKDTRFHRAMIQITGNQLLVEMYDGLNLNLQLAIAFYPMENKRLDKVGEEHDDILSALENRDARALASAIREHVRGSKTALIALMESEEANGREPVSVR